MKNFLKNGSYLVWLTLSLSCQSQNKDLVLPATQFAEKHEAMPNAPVIDVRTPEEFSKGNIGGSVNINWNGDDFANKVAAYDKSAPILVYCLAGSRSASAAAKMREMGFKQVYELDGGILKWRAAGLPERAGKLNSTNTLSAADYQALLNSEKIVLIDFYADWCGPCKKMKPWLDELAVEFKDSVEITRINADDNPELCKQLQIDALPVLLVYNKGTQQWRKVGLAGKEEIKGHLGK